MDSNSLLTQMNSLNCQIDKLCKRIEEVEISGRDPKQLLVEYSSLIQQRAQLQKQLDSEVTDSGLNIDILWTKRMVSEAHHAKAV